MAEVFFLFGQKRAFILFVPILSQFWCSVVTSVKFISNLNNFEKNKKKCKISKNSKKSKISLKIQKKKPIKTKKCQKMSKIVKNSENLKKSIISKKSEIFEKYFFFSKKKSSLFLNIRNTQFNQSSSVQPNPQNKSGKISKNHFFSQKIRHF